MPIAHADLAINCRFVLPMTTCGEVLENHTVVVRDGRIVELLPTADAALAYAPTVLVDRSQHLVLPGLVNAYTRIAPPAGRAAPPERLNDGAQWCIAEMLRSGTTCFCGLGDFPEETARHAVEQGMRAVIGIPIADTQGRWASTADEYLTRALGLRDEYRGHPTIATLFAPAATSALSDRTFGRIATLADELEAGIVIALHQSEAEVVESTTRHGARPLERLAALGLLTPLLTAVHMVHVNAADLELAQRSGIAVTLCPSVSLLSSNGPPPAAAWVTAGTRLGIGSGISQWASGFDEWNDLRLLALLAGSSVDAKPLALRAWEALAAATRGAAATLGLEADIGTLEKGKWADICCLDVSHAATVESSGRRDELVTRLVFGGGTQFVSDVWVSGRHLLNAGSFTRLDWPSLAERMKEIDQ